MQIISSPAQASHFIRSHKRAGSGMALVPTMGALHAGHVRLLSEAKKHGDFVVMSLFVNPTQFGPQEDLTRYPRDLEGDCRKAQAAGVDLVFTPSAADMYPLGSSTWVHVEGTTQTLCGAARPGHFRGVATVVTKLFHILEPDVALFGEKDFQQLATIRHLVRDLNLPIEIVSVPTVREGDGLAMSSRNAFLSAAERRAALCLFQALTQAQKLVASGQHDLAKILATTRDLISSEKLARIDYVACVDTATIQPITYYEPGKTLLALAVFIGPTRLIDNTIL